MQSTVSLEYIRSLASPFSGRTFISIYAPKAPIHLISKQLESEVNRTEKSTNWKVKGAVIMMLKQILDYLKEMDQESIPDSGFVIFSVPENEKKAIVHHVIPDKEIIDLFFYVLDERFYIKEEHFNFT